MKKKLFRWFTLIELIFAIVAVSIGLMSILYAVNYGFSNVQGTKQRVIAINLAREWIEWIYQIRDTNWLITQEDREKCWLDKNPLALDNSPDGCEEDSWMWSGSYILQRWLTGEQEYFFMSWATQLPVWAQLDLSDGIQTSDRNFAMCLTGWMWNACPGYTGNTNYFREIRGKWLFYKDSTTTGGDYLDCTKWNESVVVSTLAFPVDCWWLEAKEYRFCSRVEYIGEGRWEVEFCSLITNFLK